MFNGIGFCVMDSGCLVQFFSSSVHRDFDGRVGELLFAVNVRYRCAPDVYHRVLARFHACFQGGLMLIGENRTVILLSMTWG